MLPSAETCQRWSQRKIIRQPLRMVAGLLLCLIVTILALIDGQLGAAKVFGTLTAVFALLYAAANYIVWKAGIAQR